MVPNHTHLKLNLRLGDVLFTPIATGNLLGLGYLRVDGLCAEFLEGVSLNRVYAQDRVGLDDGKASGHCVDISRQQSPLVFSHFIQIIIALCAFAPQWSGTILLR